MITKGLRTLTIAAAFASLVGFAAGTFAAEKHPEINRAERALHNAKTALQHAASDFGGHKAAALQDIDQALNELQQAKQFDKH
ncbi:MAG TPA: hypothetical protein VKY65_05905 [Alphaproteobacteria bacterium]|nr:hypothetical protein [Alphaproteobacteria bacterium]